MILTTSRAGNFLHPTDEEITAHKDCITTHSQSFSVKSLPSPSFPGPHHSALSRDGQLMRPAGPVSIPWGSAHPSQSEELCLRSLRSGVQDQLVPMADVRRRRRELKSEGQKSSLA